MTSSIDPRHLLIVGAGPGLGASIGRRFAQGGYHVTLLARSTDGLDKLAKGLADTGAVVDTVTADAGDLEGLRSTLSALYARDGAPGVVVCSAALLAYDSLLDSDVAHLHQAFDVDVVSAVVATQVAAPAMRAGGGGTIIFTGGGWADYPMREFSTLSVGKAALRSAASVLSADLADEGVRLATITIAGQIAPGTPFDPDRIAETYWTIVESDGSWQSEFRFERT
ncbi:MAG TPA: SDR family NAD(P)-dependent oxidoreductase [Acidimicrobiales bacterium]|nr:SDR family NAD(P)-dependent oxidoreductase [Acidimicrobiales bacterium]